LPPGNKLFNPAFKDASLQQDTVLAFKAFYADIRSQSYHLPFVTAAGVLFFKADDIAYFYLHDHDAVTSGAAGVYLVARFDSGLAGCLGEILSTGSIENLPG